MDQETVEIEEQLERCRRLTRLLTDEQKRASLEKLAAEYEARLKQQQSGGAGFMLRETDGDQIARYSG
jgi:hypothetical protein